MEGQNDTYINKSFSKKGAVIAKKDNGKAFNYYANVDETSYKQNQSIGLINRLFNGSIGLMMSNFIKSNKLSKEDIEELKRIIEKGE